MFTYDQLSKMTGTPLKQAGLDVGVEYVPGETKETFLGRVMDAQLAKLAAATTPTEPDWLASGTPATREVREESGPLDKIGALANRVNDLFNKYQAIWETFQTWRNEKRFVDNNELAEALTKQKKEILESVLQAMKAAATPETADDVKVETGILSQIGKLTEQAKKAGWKL